MREVLSGQLISLFLVSHYMLSHGLGSHLVFWFLITFLASKCLKYSEMSEVNLDRPDQHSGHWYFLTYFLYHSSHQFLSSVYWYRHLAFSCELPHSTPQGKCIPVMGWWIAALWSPPYERFVKNLTG